MFIPTNSNGQKLENLRKKINREKGKKNNNNKMFSARSVIRNILSLLCFDFDFFFFYSLSGTHMFLYYTV